MPFTVSDFPDLIRLLGEHPEWQADLRRHVLTQELIELPELVRRLAEAQERTAQRVEDLALAQERTEHEVRALAERLDGAIVLMTESFAKIDERFAKIDERFAKMDERFEQLLARVDWVEVRLSHLEGEALETRYTRRAAAYFSRLLLRIKVIDSSALATLLDAAADKGQISADERDEIMLADLVLTGRRRDDGVDAYLLAEISMGIGESDVRRAGQRGALLEKLGMPVLRVVAGQQSLPHADTLARITGVWQVVDGREAAPTVTVPNPPRTG